MKGGTRKRILKWTTIAVGAALLGGAFWAFGLLRPHSDYEFLHGHRTILIEVETAWLTHSPGTYGTAVIKFYTFRGRFEDIVAEATPELASLGIPKVIHDVGSMAAWSESMLALDLQITAERAVLNEEGLDLAEEKGWVTVTVFQYREPNLSERLRIWLQDRGL
ncbi:MAG: hypothetical protein IH851_00530 [Armatimonadetes bacterium]|nr:hypothetical protein [Armatimonadota bacterium]